MTPTLHLSDIADDSVREAIIKPLRAFNESMVGTASGRPLVITICDSDGEIIGGLWGSTGYGWLFTQLLVVPESLRGQHLGSKMLALAEAEALKRDCHGAWLDTFEFQARGFYEALGYECFGEIPDFPIGYKRFFMRKTLSVTS